MPDIFNFSNSAYFIAIAFCLLTAVITWKFSGNNDRHNRLLSAYFFCLGYGNLLAFLLYSGLLAYWPWFHLYRTGQAAALNFMPFSFFYFRVLIKRTGIRAIDLFHFLPAVVFIIDYIPVYLMPAAEKLATATADVSTANRGQLFMNGLIRPHIDWMAVLLIQVAVYWLIQIRMLLRLTRMKQSQEMLSKNRALFRWLTTMCLVQTLYFVPYLINAFFGSDRHNFVIAYTSISASTLVLVALLLLNPEILYGLKGMIVARPLNIDLTDQPISMSRTEREPGVEQAAKEEEELSKKTVQFEKMPEYLPEEKIHLIRQKIEEVLSAQQPYLGKGYSIRDLSVVTGYQPYLLSSVINQAYGKRFTDFINYHRIAYACGLIDSGSAELLTLEALAEKCGFSNRNSFTSAFKRVTGKTPSAYLKQSGH